MGIKNSTKLNVIMSLLQQAVITICGFILPRIILRSFGSAINGLVSSINQFLSYISLLEGGITGVVSASLYKPLVEKNSIKLSAVIKAADSFYKKISYIFIAYTVVVAIIYPLVVETGQSYSFVSSLVLILGINLFVQYYFSITWKTLLIADKKMYLVSAVYIGVVVINTIMTVALINLYPSIHLVKIASALIYFAQPLLYHRFGNKFYNIDFSVSKDDRMLSQRWDGFGINIAAFIHNNTDVIVLTLLATLSDVSVYSVYFLVVTGLKSIVLAVSQGISPSIGQLYAKGNKEDLDLQFGKFESIMLFLAFFLFTVGGFSITPFVQIYTSGVADANYYQPVFGWIIVLAELVFCIREPYVVLAYAANRFKQFTVIAYIETGINILTSVILVYCFGIVGVAIGTLLAMLFRTLCQIIYLKRHILHRSAIRLFSKIGINIGGFLLVLIIEKFLIPACQYTVKSWVIYCVLLSITAGIIYMTATIIENDYYRNRLFKIGRGK